MSLRSEVRRRIREWFETLRWRQSNVAAVSRSLAIDVGAPPEAINRILCQAASELRELAARDSAADAWPIINKAINDLDRFEYRSSPSEEAMMERCLDELSEHDANILLQFKQGKKHQEIATLMGVDVDSVRRSLVKTYADLRMKMMNRGGGGGGQPIELPRSEQPSMRRVG